MVKIRVVGYQKVADFTSRDGNVIRGSSLHYLSEPNSYQIDGGFQGSAAGHIFLSAARFNYPDVTIGNYYMLDTVRSTAVSLNPVE